LSRKQALEAMLTEDDDAGLYESLQPDDGGTQRAGLPCIHSLSDLRRHLPGMMLNAFEGASHDLRDAAQKKLQTLVDAANEGKTVGRIKGVKEYLALCCKNLRCDDIAKAVASVDWRGYDRAYLWDAAFGHFYLSGKKVKYAQERKWHTTKDVWRPHQMAELAELVEEEGKKKNDDRLAQPFRGLQERFTFDGPDLRARLADLCDSRDALLKPCEEQGRATAKRRICDLIVVAAIVLGTGALPLGLDPYDEQLSEWAAHFLTAFAQQPLHNAADTPVACGSADVHMPSAETSDAKRSREADKTSEGGRPKRRKAREASYPVEDLDDEIGDPDFEEESGGEGSGDEGTLGGHESGTDPTAIPHKLRAALYDMWIMHMIAVTPGDFDKRAADYTIQTHLPHFKHKTIRG